MPTKVFGNNYLLWVESATPGTYNYVQGQGNMKVTRNRDKIDTSDKTTAGYKTNAYGLSDLSISLDVEPVLPDANGYTRLETIANTVPAAPVNVQVRKNGTGGATGDVVLQALMYVNMSDDDYGKNTVVTKTFEFALATAPVTDALA